MSTVLETIEAKKRAMIPQRLVKGAEIMGRLWREGVRCISAWTGICPCQTPNDFCTAKKKWLALVREYHDGKYPHDLSGNEGFLVLECMDLKMFEVSGLTIAKTVPGARAPIRIGRRGTCPQTILDLEELYNTDWDAYQGALEAVIKIQEVL